MDVSSAFGHTEPQQRPSVEGPFVSIFWRQGEEWHLDLASSCDDWFGLQLPHALNDFRYGTLL